MAIFSPISPSGIPLCLALGVYPLHSPVAAIRFVVGEVLRRARKARGLTLRALQAQSGGRFKPSAVGGYERGERAISVERFIELAVAYGVPADRLMAQVLDVTDPSSRPKEILDLAALEAAEEDEVRPAIRQPEPSGS